MGRTPREIGPSLPELGSPGGSPARPDLASSFRPATALGYPVFKNDGRVGLTQVDPIDRVRMITASGEIDLTGLHRAVISAGNTDGELTDMDIQGYLGPLGLPQDIISVGQTLRAGCKIHLELPDSMVLLPSGDIVPLHLTDQDIVALRHDTHATVDTNQCSNLTRSKCHVLAVHVACQVKTAVTRYLHCLFPHTASRERLCQTVKQSTGSSIMA